jgi:hypothetical protein
MQDEVAAVGTPEWCAASIAARRSRGLQLPVVAPFTVGNPIDDYRAAIQGCQ